MGESEVVVLEHKRLNIDKIKSNDKLLDCLVLNCEEQNIMQNEIDNNNACDYKEILIKIVENNHVYLFLHGFPGDHGVGCVLLENDEFAEIGEDCDYANHDNNDLNIINQWYCKITKDCCDYADDFWY